MFQLIQFFLSQKWEVYFGTTALKNENSIHFTSLGVKEYALKLNDQSFDELIKAIDPTLVLFDRFMTEEQFGWRVATACPDAMRILDTEDLHCLRKIRKEALKKEVVFHRDQLLYSDITKREIAAIYRSDLSLVISSYEMNLLKECFQIKSSLLCYLPFFLDTISKKDQDNWNSYEERQHFISIGNFLHAPNVDATIILKNTLWKLIKKQLLNAELHVYGAYPSQQILQMNAPKDGFFVYGFVSNAHGAIQNSRVLLAPLRFGAGIKGKLTDAMQCGTPSVTTSIGAEGMHGNLPWNGFVTDTWEVFAEQAVQLYSKRSVWIKAQENGIEICNQCYSKKVMENRFLEVIKVQFENLKTIRHKNFIGQMLQHHTLQSTKYLSKWIEEKNRK